MKTILPIIAILLMPATGLTWDVVPEPEPVSIVNNNKAYSSSSSSAEANANAIQGQLQGQAQQQGQEQTAIAHGGEAIAHGGNAESNANNAVTVQTTYRQVRNAPPVAQGALMIGQCGAGVNGGGSNTSGAAFLGIAWTPRDCHRYLTAANYAALGMYSMSCAILNTTRAAKETVAELGIPMPTCDFFEKTVTVEEVRYVTPAELDAAVLTLQESQDRAWRSAQGAK